jgi:23S rRNA-/tRNA-specific pseudouridylate synthase
MIGRFETMTSSVPHILAETPDWWVVDKPAGWLSVAGSPQAPSDTPSAPVLTDFMRAEKGELWVVHRLDLQTSGVILFARNPDAHRRASLWFQKHEVKKLYDCICVGVPSLPVMRINREVAGVMATTQVEVKERFEKDRCFRAQVLPLSGKRHQIRIHLSSQGFPILGDPQYGGPKVLNRAGGDVLPISRVALHARKLKLPSGEQFEAPWPPDFAGWLDSLRSSFGETRV